jgi:hypothetical protein
MKHPDRQSPNICIGVEQKIQSNPSGLECRDIGQSEFDTIERQLPQTTMRKLLTTNKSQ